MAIYNNMHSKKIKKNESFKAFENCLRTHYHMCIRSGFPHKDCYLVQCFINGLDTNFDHAHKLLQNGTIQWYGLTFNEVIHGATEVKLNRQSSGTWTTNDGTHLVGKQGTKRPSSSDSRISNDNTVTINPDIPTHCYKPADLTFEEVQSIMQQYSCCLCRHNGHPLHEYSSLSRVYYLSEIQHHLLQRHFKLVPHQQQ